MNSEKSNLNLSRLPSIIVVEYIHQPRKTGPRGLANGAQMIKSWSIKYLVAEDFCHYSNFYFFNWLKVYLIIFLFF